MLTIGFVKVGPLLWGFLLKRDSYSTSFNSLKLFIVKQSKSRANWSCDTTVQIYNEIQCYAAFLKLHSYACNDRKCLGVFHSKKDPSVVFLANPSTVVFTEYQVGRVYELPLELKNISTASRPLRIIPPKSQFFSVGLGRLNL